MRMGSKSLDLNIATNKRYGDSRLVAKSPFSEKATVYLATVTIATVANYTLPKELGQSELPVSRKDPKTTQKMLFWAFEQF